MKLAFSMACALFSCALFGGEELADLSALTAKYAADEKRLRAAYGNCVSRLDHPSEGIVVPVESHPDGSVKVDVIAGKAQFFDKESLVWCGDVTVREYNPDGTLRLELKADNCVVDRGTRSGWLEGSATGKYGKTEISGRGIYFSFPDEFVKISSKVTIISSDLDFKGVKL